MEDRLWIDVRCYQIDSFTVLNVIDLYDVSLTRLGNLRREFIHANDITVVGHLVPLIETRLVQPFLHLIDFKLL